MKKSFLITLAAVSSVALIGCSSSSDDNGGSKGPEKKYEYKVSNVLVAPITAVKADATHLASNVTFTLEKKEQGNAEAVLEPATDEEKANFKIGVICDADTDGAKANKFVVTANKIAISKDKAKELASDSCNVEVTGDFLPESEAKSAKIDLTEENYNKGAASVSIDGKGVDNTAKTISLNAAVDTAAKYTVTATEAGTLTVDETKKTIEIADGDAITELTIAGEKLDKVFEDATETDDIFTLDASKAATAIDNGKVSISKDTKITTPVDYKVTISKEGGQKPQIEQTPVEDMASTSPAVVIKVTGLADTVKTFTCAQVGAESKIGNVVVKKESGHFLVGVDKTKLTDTDTENKSKCTGDNLPAEGFEVDFNTAKSELKPLVTVVDTSNKNTPLAASLVADTVLKQLKATGVKNLKNYAADTLNATDAAIADVNNIVVSSTNKADATILAVGAKATEDPADNNVTCTNANLLGNGCEFALKAVAQGKGKLIFSADNGASNLNGAKETIAIEVTANTSSR